MDSWEINGHTLEYYDDEHQYLVDGVCVPSITQILKVKFGNKYFGVSKEVLERASELGTSVHNAIEQWCKNGTESELIELHNFKLLQKHFNFVVIDNEVPIILFKDDEPIAAGRLDLVLGIDGEIGLGDIKRTSQLDKEYLAYQLNLYRIGYKQCYGVDIKFLKGFHLREDKRKIVPIPINEDMAMELVNKYMEVN